MGGTPVDELTIKIEAESQKANSSIDALVKKLDKLTISLGKVDGARLSGLASGVQKLGNAAKTLNGIKATDYNRIAKGFERFAKIDYSGLSKTSSGLNTLAKSLSALSNVQNLGNVTPAINAVKNLAKVDMGGFDTAKMSAIASAVSGFAKELSNVSPIEGSVTKVVSAIARLSNSGQYIGNVTTYFPILGNQVTALVGDLSTAGAIDAGVAKVVDGIARLASAGKKIETTVANLNSLGDGVVNLVTRLNGLPQVNANLANMIQGLGNIATSGTKAGNVVGGLSTKLSAFSRTSSSATKKSFNLASAIGKVYASYWLLFRAFRKLGDAIDLSSDLTEVQNIVDVTFGEYTSLVEKMSETSITDFGMSELTVKEVSSRFQAMGTAMGFAQGKMADMSIELTKLTADMASFYNMDQEDVAQDLESVFTGQTRPLRTYGLDLTEATLKEWALKNGLDANIDSMSQAEKTMLRYQYVLANTGAAQGDFARTSDTWANQTRILKQNIEQLGVTIGGTLINALKPVVKALNIIIGKFKEFAVAVSNSLGVIFGWKYEDSAGGVATDIEDAEDSSGGLSDNLGSAADNAKKLKSHLLGIDELNVYEPDTDSSSGSGSSGSGSVATGSSGGQWSQVDSMLKAYESELDNLYKLGEFVGEKLTNALKGIDWQSIYEGARNFGTGLADFLNGLISPELFGAVGSTIASALNTAIYAALSFGNTFDFEEFGLSIATGINVFFATFDFASLAESINTWVQGIWETIKTTIENIKWEDVWNGAKEFLENIDIETVAIVLGAVTIKEISALHLGSAALEMIGTTLTAGLANAFSGMGTTFMAGLKGLFGSEAATSALSFISPVTKAVTGIGTVIAGVALAVTNFFSMWKNGFSWIKEALMVTGTILAAVGAVILGAPALVAGVIAGIVAAVATIAVVVHENWDKIVEFFKNALEKIKEIWGKVKEWFGENVAEPIASVFTGIWEKAKEIFTNVKDYLQEKFELAVTKIKDVFSPLTNWFHEKWDAIKKVFKDVKKFFTDAFQSAYDSVKKIWDGIGDFFGGIANKIIDPIQKAVNGIIKGINWVLEKIGSGTRISEWADYPKFAKGANGLSEDTIGMVNDQKGSTYKELIVPPHGEPFIPEGRNVLLPLEKGTKIMPANQTKAFMSMSGIPKFEGGIGAFFSNAWESIKSFTGNVLDYIAHPSKLVQLAIDKFVDASNWLGVLGDLAKGVVNKTFDSAVAFVKKLFDSSTTATYIPGAGVEQWRALATTALKITGQYSESNLTALLSQMSHESGGNPNAINNWDINAKNGTPSKGLMQVIDSTFTAHALSPYNKNVYDPLSNMIAAIRYTVSRYGSLYAGWTARGYKGYASGVGKIDFTDLIPAYSVGGYPEDGLFYANHNELVGQFSNGKTAVANNDDIQSGIKQGVKEAVSEMLAPYLREIARNTRETADKDFVTRIDTRTLVNEYNSRSRRNGFSFT